MTAPLHVLHVLNGASGGASESTLGLIEALRPHGVASSLVCHDMGDERDKARLRDVVEGRALFTQLYWWNHKIRAKRWKRPALELLQLLRTGAVLDSTRRVAAFAKAQGCTLVHTNTILTPEGGLAARALGLPHVWHVRELVGDGDPFPLVLPAPLLGLALDGLADRVIANSAATAARLVGIVPPLKLVTIENGLELAGFSRGVPSADGVVRVGMVGSLTSRWKQHSLLLEAFALLSRELPARLSIHGHDPGTADIYAAALHRRAEGPDLVERVSFPGFDDSRAIFGGLDLYAHPAEHESFGRVVVEAMAAGLPVIGMRGGGVEGIVVDGETGVLVPPNDARALAAAIERLVRDPDLRARFGATGRIRAESRYAIGVHATRVLAVYRGLVKGP